MSEYDKTRDAARKVREKYDKTLRNLEDDVIYIVVKDTVKPESPMSKPGDKDYEV